MEHYGHGGDNHYGQLGQNAPNSHVHHQFKFLILHGLLSLLVMILLYEQLKLMEHYGHGDIMTYGQLGQNNRTSIFITSSNTWYYMGMK